MRMRLIPRPPKPKGNMKRIAIILLVSVSLSVMGTSSIRPANLHTSRVAPVPIRDEPTKLPIPPIDPYRVINGQTVEVNKQGVPFRGVVLKVQTNGVYISGRAGDNFSGGFFVERFPYQVAEGYVLGDRYFAIVSGVCTLETGQTVYKLDYGEIWKHKPPPPKTQAEKDASVLKVLKFHESLAAKGDAYGQWQMGLRFLKGDMVQKDLAKARQLLKQSADQGNKDAAAELTKMDAQPVVVKAQETPVSPLPSATR